MSLFRKAHSRIKKAYRVTSSKVDNVYRTYKQYESKSPSPLKFKLAQTRGEILTKRAKKAGLNPYMIREGRFK